MSLSPSGDENDEDNRRDGLTLDVPEPYMDDGPPRLVISDGTPELVD